MTELTRQILRAEMSHSLMNGFSVILPALAEENDAKFERSATENAKLRELLAELYYCSRQTGCGRCLRSDGCGTLAKMLDIGIEV